MDRHANEMAMLMMSRLIAVTDCRGVGDALIFIEIRGQETLVDENILSSY